MTHTRSAIRSGFAAVLIVLIATSILAFSSIAAERDERAIASIASAQAYLARLQREDGAFGSETSPIATTATALLGFIATGSIPDAGRYGLLVRKAGDYLIKEIPPDGYVGSSDVGGMRGQSLVTLALAEALAVETDAQQRTRIRTAIARLVSVIVRAQAVKKPDGDAGGFGPNSDSTSSDPLTTCGVLLALRAAGNVGVAVPRAIIDDAAGYLKRCLASQAGTEGRPGGEVSPIASAAIVVVLSLLDFPDSSQLIVRSRDAIGRPPEPGMSLDAIFFKLHAARLLPDAPWASVWPASRDRVIAMQASDGSVSENADAPEPARIYSTASALLVLSSPDRLLIAFEK